MSVRHRLLKWGLRHPSFFPPFVGAGIRVVTADPGGGIYRVRMKLSFYNRNALGTHFGGSLYAMCDPFLALILIYQLGPDYAVWDKTSTIEFRRPGRGTVSATFEIPPEKIGEIRAAADAGEVVEPVFEVRVIDESGDTVARVTKTIHVSHKTLRSREPTRTRDEGRGT